MLPAAAEAGCGPAAPACAQPAPPPPPKPVTEKVTFAADVLFDFDKSVLKPEGKAKLDDLVSKLKGVALEVIIAIGHTDPIGNRRVQPEALRPSCRGVKAYLVSKGIEPNRIYTEGKGLTQQVNCPSPRQG